MKQKGFAAVLILVVILVVGVGAAAYYVGSMGLLKKTAASPTLSPVQTTVPTNDSILNITGTLQDYLKSNCVPGNPRTIDSSKLPVKINFTAANLSVKNIYCSSIQDNTQPIKSGFIGVVLNNNSTINIYDDDSQELGHGGPPFLGFFGQKIFDKNGVQIGAWIQGGDGPQILGEVGISIRGVKRFETKTGSPVYVNYTTLAITGSDARLVNQLKPFASPDPDLGVDVKQINYDSSISAQVVNFFFNPIPSNSSPEGKALQNINNIFAAITAK